MTPGGTGREAISLGGSPGGAAPLVVLVRHGETEWSRSGRHTGRSDIALDPEGEAQARWLRHRLREWRFATVMVSPLRRARKTCDIAGFGRAARVEPDLQEWDYGSYEGRTAEEIREQRPGWTIWRDGVVGGETAEDVARRAESVLASVRAAGGDVALFAHGHLLRILAARWCDLPPVAGEHLAFSAGAISILGSDRDAPIIWRWNDTSHLPAGDHRW
ncbi:MAG TPA: histidine phosphatase family protein [Candidatus Binatia bacterium]|nr:histidine phosphatase family protein [Candidatus Binatia bacterium]